jgi:hypothetical protein
LFCFSVIYET